MMIKAKLHILFLFSVVLLCSSVSAQTEQVDPTNNVMLNLKTPAEIGTYEVYTGGKDVILFTKEHLILIEEKRHDTEEVMFYFGYNTTIRILPRSVIEREDFVPLTEK